LVWQFFVWRFFFPAGIEGFQGAVPGAADGGLVAGQGGKHTGAAAVAIGNNTEDAGVLGAAVVVGIEIVIPLGLAFAGLLEGELEVAGFDAGETGEASLGVGHAGDQEFFDGALRTELGGERVEDGLEIVLILDGEGGVLRQKAVAKGVEAGAGLAFVRARAGAFEGVPAVGFDLFLGCHVGLGRVGGMGPALRG
jgi:hypothetical protein